MEPTTSMTTLELPAVMTTKELGAILGLSSASLCQDRYLGIGIPFIKIGAKRVRYLRDDVLKYLQDNRMQRTDDRRGAGQGCHCAHDQQ